MVGWTIVMIGIMLIGLVVVFQWKQRKAGHIAYWQQQRQVEQRRGEAASRLPNSLERRQKMDHAKASVERIDGELSRLAGSRGSVGQHTS
jgi:FtsZ-interacting cell division protein ZipA